LKTSDKLIEIWAYTIFCPMEIVVFHLSLSLHVHIFVKQRNSHARIENISKLTVMGTTFYSHKTNFCAANQFSKLEEVCY